jgi:hypothetical protein
MIQPTTAVASANPGALLADFDAAKSTTASQVGRLMNAMVRVREADSRLDDAQAKFELGSNALLLYRIHTMLFGAAASEGRSAAPEPEAAPPTPAMPTRSEAAEAYSEFQSLRESMLRAAAEVDQLLTNVEQALSQFDRKWKAAP